MTMKLERVNENQIRCTLTKEDLEIRQIKISEIAYGSLKTKMLFKDVMQQANYELGFEAENIPLMIEAIPMSTGCLVFIITKVDNPEELDTRFSRFAPSVIEDNDYDNSDNDDDNDYDSVVPFADDNLPENNENSGNATAHIEVVGSEAIKNFLENITGTNSAEGFVDLFKKISAGANAKKQLENAPKTTKKSPYRLFVFEDLSVVAKACKLIESIFKGNSALYKNTQNNSFYLILEKDKSDEREFVKLCNLLMEYGTVIPTSAVGIAHVKEHYKCLIENDAVSGMAQF